VKKETPLPKFSLLSFLRELPLYDNTYLNDGWPILSCGVNNMAEDNFGMSSKDKWIENLQQKVLDGEGSYGDVQSILDHGQVTDFRPIVLLDQMPEEVQQDYEDHVVAVLKDYHRNGTVSVDQTTKIVKGKCGHCGSNRLKVSFREPEGIACTECPVCQRNDMDSSYDFEYEIGGAE
jgi:hypothetical protein